MANRDILQLPSKLFATTRQRWSEPPHRPLAWNFNSTSYWLPADTSRSGLVTAQAQEVTSSEARRSEVSSQDSRTSLEKLGVQRSRTAYSDYSLELASSDDCGALHSVSWRPSFFRIGPMIGLTALLLALLQIPASYTVLKVSNGSAVKDWPLKPPVYLAILTVVSNGAISFALTQGAVVSFWLRALRGTTLADLQRDWAYGSDFYNALCAGKHVTVLAAACVAATLVCIDGPLLQRASFTRPAALHQPVALKTSVVPEIPAYFTGSYNFGAEWPKANYSDEVFPVVMEFAANKSIIGAVQGCDGTCTATIRAPALVPTHCNITTTRMNYSTPYTAEEMPFIKEGNIPPTRTLFDSITFSHKGSHEVLEYKTWQTSDEVAATCAGLVRSTHCFLRSAIADYDIAVINNTVTLQDAANPKWVAWANNTELTDKSISEHHLRDSDKSNWVKTTLSGIVGAFVAQYQLVEGAKAPDESGRVKVTGEQTLSWFTMQHIANYKEYNDGDACLYAWIDPRPAAMAGMNELMFRIGVHAANRYDLDYLKPLLDQGVRIHQNVIGLNRSPYEIYETVWGFYVAAVIVELLCLALVGATFWGYQRIGRDVSLSPLETAKAFGALLLANAPCNSRGERIASHLEAERVRYGHTYCDAKTDKIGQGDVKLMIARQDSVNVPTGERLTIQEHRAMVKSWILERWQCWRALFTRQ